jgi:hypothetical protein
MTVIDTHPDARKLVPELRGLIDRHGYKAVLEAVSKTVRTL